MGMPPSTTPYYTVDQVLTFPDDGNRYELVYGELLVSPTPRVLHQRVVMRLSRLLVEYCEREGVGEPFSVSADLTWGRQDVLTQPDVFVVSHEQTGFQQWRDMRQVLLVAEVLSPASKHHDRFKKRLVYRDQGVAVYWILDADEGIVEVWTPDAQFPVVEREQLTWRPEGASSPLHIDIPTLLRP